MLCHESGETLESNIFLPKIADAQKLTGSITYLRRTSYLSILGLVADDDLDGNDIVQAPQSQTVKQAPPKEATRPTFQVESIGQQRPLQGAASDAQKNALRKMGIKFEENITKDEASRLIGEAKRN
jgi:hypothetical protein